MAFQKATRAWTGTTGAPATTQPVHIGDRPGTGGAEYFAGVIDDVRIYNRALRATEIANFYGSFGGNTAPPVLSNITASLISTSGATIR